MPSSCDSTGSGWPWPWSILSVRATRPPAFKIWQDSYWSPSGKFLPFPITITCSSDYFWTVDKLAKNIRSSSLGISRCHSLSQKNVYGLVIVPNHNSLCWIGEIVWTNCVKLGMVQTFLLFRPEPPWKYQIWHTNFSKLNQIRSERNRTTEKTSHRLQVVQTFAIFQIWTKKHGQTWILIIVGFRAKSGGSDLKHPNRDCFIQSEPTIQVWTTLAV